jgi:hypothetical protein
MTTLRDEEIQTFATTGGRPREQTDSDQDDQDADDTDTTDVDTDTTDPS